MASAQIWRNNDRNWNPPYLLTIGIWTGFLGLLSEKLEHQTLSILLVWNFSIMLLIANSDLSPCAYMPYTELNWISSCALEHPTVCGVCSCTVLSSSWVTMLSSWKVHRRKIQVFACLCNVTAHVVALWSMLRNIKFVSHSHWDTKGPSSQKWYGRMLNHLLKQLYNALAHCLLDFSYRFYAGFICQLCCLVGK